MEDNKLDKGFRETVGQHPDGDLQHAGTEFVLAAVSVGLDAGEEQEVAEGQCISGN